MNVSGAIIRIRMSKTIGVSMAYSFGGIRITSMLAEKREVVQKSAQLIHPVREITPKSRFVREIGKLMGTGSQVTREPRLLEARPTSTDVLARLRARRIDCF